ncbi:MAG: ANTAR domain-containing protein [Hyphomicrobiales bacterium]|nr:ANTAR domain-containing protein [Hyphomicrobiales bacterium]
MTRQSPFSIHGRHALMLVRDEREISIVRRQLNRLGMTITEGDPTNSTTPSDIVDVIILDADIIPIKSNPVAIWKMDIPLIVLVGTETPSRLKWLLELKPASFLVKPLRSAGLYTALVVAFDHVQRRSEVAKRIERLEERVRSRRIVLAAVLQIMRRHDLCEPDAFSLIRRTAMQYRTTIEQLSADIIAIGGMPGMATRIA